MTKYTNNAQDFGVGQLRKRQGQPLMQYRDIWETAVNLIWKKRKKEVFRVGKCWAWSKPSNRGSQCELGFTSPCKQRRGCVSCKLNLTFMWIVAHSQKKDSVYISRPNTWIFKKGEMEDDCVHKHKRAQPLLGGLMFYTCAISCLHWSHVVKEHFKLVMTCISWLSYFFGHGRGALICMEHILIGGTP